MGEQGDTLECGLTASGCVYFIRNGDRVAQAKGFWPTARAYPTVTFNSGGAEVEINLSEVEEKPLMELGDGEDHKSAFELLSAFKNTAIPDVQRKHGAGVPGIPFLDRLLGPCCGQIQVARAGMAKPRTTGRM